MVILKTKEEIKKIKESCQIVVKVLQRLKSEIEPGITTRYLNTLAEEITAKHNAVPGFLGYKGFPYAICASKGDTVVHGLVSDKPLREGTILSIDFGILKNGWYGDAAFTAPVGEVFPRVEKLLKITEECLYKGIEKAVPGNRLGDISNTIQEHAESVNFNVIRNYVGHGIGRDLHEDPQIKNFGTKGEGVLLKEGMVLAIEPMVVMKGHKTKVLKDGWTVKTKDKGLACHFEHTIVVAKNGPEILTKI